MTQEDRDFSKKLDAIQDEEFKFYRLWLLRFVAAAAFGWFLAVFFFLLWLDCTR